tara:strand:+ start:2885 stop:2998 length:114 start_codon:yes stop_codon:yes gene_type:complete
MKRTYWIKFKNSEFKKDNELVYKKLTNLRLQEMKHNA